MKMIVATTLFFTCIIPALANAADQYVNGYYRKDGTYVQSYHRSAPDDNFYNNYSSQGNTNPYKGKEGTVTYEQYQEKRQNQQNNSGLYGK